MKSRLFKLMMLLIGLATLITSSQTIPAGPVTKTGTSVKYPFIGYLLVKLQDHLPIKQLTRSQVEMLINTRHSFFSLGYCTGGGYFDVICYPDSGITINYLLCDDGEYRFSFVQAFFE